MHVAYGYNMHLFALKITPRLFRKYELKSKNASARYLHLIY